jgi:hypothetical protein
MYLKQYLWQAFEEAELPKLKEEKPGLTLNQYKDMIWKLWKKSPDNPLNQVCLHKIFTTTSICMFVTMSYDFFSYLIYVNQVCLHKIFTTTSIFMLVTMSYDFFSYLIYVNLTLSAWGHLNWIVHLNLICKHFSVGLYGHF